MDEAPRSSGTRCSAPQLPSSRRSALRPSSARGPPYVVQIDGVETLRERDMPPAKKPYQPVFCALAFLACSFAFVCQMQRNGWRFQPLTCPEVCAGRPCNVDGTPCEANLLLGPTVAVLNAMGAKNDEAIFERNEWWRIIACNWLHAGLVHLAFNMAAIYQLGVDLEKAFGFWRVGTLYLCSGIFGTIVSIVFLPGVLSVGASASVFGLVGAAWADVIVNFCARGTLKGSGICSLTIVTVLNVMVGLTPWVDNFMHLGGLIAGIVVGVSLFAKKKYDERRGERRRTLLQEICALLAALLLVALAVAATCAISSADVRDHFRTCPICDHLNCVETAWWSCCITQATGSCELLGPPVIDGVQATCNMTGMPPFVRNCSSSEDWCVLDPVDVASQSALCGALCSVC